jgi:flagellar hook-associated protein 2
MSTITNATFRVGGLASGLDTNSIIDNLVKIETDGTVGLSTAQKAAFTSQISMVSDLVSRLSLFSTAAKGLSTSGVLGVTQVGTNSGFTASPSSSAVAGTYAVQVTSLAQAAKARSQSFASSSAQVQGGTLSLSVRGTTYDVTIEDGQTLSGVAASINSSGAPVRATILSSGGLSYLSITNRDTGHAIGQPAASALVISEATTGSTGQPLLAAITQPAKNAAATVDGLPFESSTNALGDAVPGAVLNLQKLTSEPEDLVLSNDAAATEANLKKWVDAYNVVMSLVRSNLNIGQQTDRAKTLGGDSALRTLQGAMQSLVSRPVGGSSTVRSLSDLGVETGIDGQLKIDSKRLAGALAADPAAVNAMFQNASAGLSARTEALAQAYTNGSDGILTGRKRGLDQSVRRLESQILSQQARVDALKTRLITQFAAMERIVSSFKDIGNYLTQQDNQRKNNG